MKLCPQCDFIYEDDQSVCDMDGKELVSGSATVLTRQSIATSVSPTPTTGTDIPPKQLAQRRWQSFALATLIGFVLAALVIFVYLARTYQSRTRRGPEVSQPAKDRSAEEIRPQSISGDTSGQASPSDLVSAQTPLPDAALPAQSVEQSTESSSAELDSSQSSTESLAHTRLTPGQVSAGTPSGISRGPAIVRLTNGAAIRADEAWEKREGIWYRQGGVVTFLKRSQVRAIEPLSAPTPRSKSVAYNAGEKSKHTETAPEPDKESKVTSFLKKTGRILKKPFKF